MPTCSTPLGAIVTTDGAAAGAASLKIDPTVTDSWITLDTPIDPADTQWVYTSFAVYIPSWAAMWDGGNAWPPGLISLASFPFGQWYWYLQPTSATTGEIIDADGNAYAISDGAWVAVELAYVADDGSTAPKGATQAWINNVDQGLITDASSFTQLPFVTIGDTNLSAAPADLTYYFDELTWSLNGRIGPVDLSGAFFTGVGTGTAFDACTGDPVTAHPNPDFYNAFEGHTLNVSAPGVMINDVLPTTVSLNTGPANGSLILNTDGSFSYTPNAGFLGVDTWTYNGNGGTATVTITVLVQTPRAIFSSEPAFVPA